MKKIVIVILIVLSIFLCGCKNPKIKVEYDNHEQTQIWDIEFEGVLYYEYSKSIVTIEDIIVENEDSGNLTIEVVLSIKFIEFDKFPLSNDDMADVKICLCDANGKLVAEEVAHLFVKEAKSGKHYERRVWFENIPNKKVTYNIVIPEKINEY